MVAGSNGNIKNDRFMGELRTFADGLRQAQTRAYTIQTGNISNCSTTSLAPGGLGSACYWRGTVLDLAASTSADQTYVRSLLYGEDLSSYTGNTLQQDRLLGKTTDQTFSLRSINLQTITLTDASGISTNVPSLSLAYLAPDGKAYSCLSSCTPSPSNTSPFTDSRRISFSFRDASSKLTGIVTFDPISGTISTMVK